MGATGPSACAMIEEHDRAGWEERMFITPVSEDAASDDVEVMYTADEQHWGFLPNFTRAFSLHPQAYGAWAQLITAIRGNMDRRRCELVTLAAARTLGTTYCSIAHAHMLHRWFDAPTIAALATDHHDAGLDELDVAVMDFAERVARDPVGVTKGDVDALRAHGLDDRDVLDVVLAVAARCFFATVIEAVGAQADAPLAGGLDDDLVEILTVGRPVEDPGGTAATETADVP